MTDAAKDRGFARQLFILLLLVGGVILLHRFAVPSGVDPTAMLALGFVVLASYTIGELVGVIKLPHITGYLLAGMVFGPSAAHLLDAYVDVFPPLDEGILNQNVVDSLSVLDTLAVALIALTAGGELKIEGLRRGMRAILGVLSGQVVTIALFVTGYVWLVSGPIPGFVLPGLEDIPAGAGVGLGLVVAAIAIATSPAATIAVINSSGADGPMTRTVLSAVVLKDVVVVVLFSLASVMATAMLGIASSGQDLGSFFLLHIGGSLAVGTGLGFLLALYLRYVGREVLLVIVGVVYAATLLAKSLHLDPVLLFIAAGFTASNFSRAGDTLIHNVERLSMPVYVVFFTLAGAKLHLDELGVVLPFALGLVAVRLLALRAGVGVGARVGNADAGTRRWGWLGFVSQAGVSISLGTIIAQRFGDIGDSVNTLIIAGVAIHELVGPVLLKVALGLAKELPGEKRATIPPAEPGHGLAPEAGEVLPGWPEPEDADPWGSPPSYGSPELGEVVRDLRADLVVITRDVSRSVTDKWCVEAEAYLRELRREYLRHHRRLLVHAKSHDERSRVSQVLHAEIADLAERYRGAVLGRSARVEQRSFDATGIVEAIDRTVDGLPELLIAPFDPSTYAARSTDGAARATARVWLRMRRRVRGIFGGEPRRNVDVRAIARYHLGGRSPSRIEGLPALLVQADIHLAGRTRSLFDAIARGYEQLVIEEIADAAAFDRRLRELRTSVEEELDLARDEIERIRKDATRRIANVLGEALRALSVDLVHMGGPDLSPRQRQSSRLFKERVRALEALGTRYEAVKRTLSALYSLLGLELDLIGLEARISDALEQHVTQLAKDSRGRGIVQAERVAAALEDAKAPLERVLSASERTGEDMVAAIREILVPIEKVAGEASRTAMLLRDQLSEEATVAPLLDALRRATASLAERYEAPEGRLARGEFRLPDPVDVMEIAFRELVTLHVEANVAPKLASTTRSLASKVQPLVSSLGEVERLLAFNVELAGTELDVVHDEPVPESTRALLEEMLLGALERSTDVVHGHVEASRGWAAELGDGMRDAVLGGVRELRGQLVDGVITRDRVDLLRRRAQGRRLIQRAETLPSLLARARRIAARTFVGLVGEERLEVWRRVLGLPSPAPVDVVDARSFSRPEPPSAVPLVYKRLFVADTLEAADVLTGREAAIERAKRALSGKTAGRLRSVALVGQDGVGKGALSAAIVRSLGFRGVRRVSFDRPVTREAIDEAFIDRQDGQLFVVSGFHWIVAMRIGGFEALSHFVDRVIRDEGRNAWLVHADHLVWDVACQAAPVADAFPAIIRVETLGAAELEAAVLARHALSGYGLNFEPRTERTRLEEIFARGASRIRRPYESFFRSLHTASGGLVRDALRLWLASIDEVNEAADFVRVGAVPSSPHAALRRLPEDVLLNLYQVARQGWMDATVQAQLYRVDPTTAEAQLSRLVHMGLLEPREHGAYRIPAHLRGPVYRVLCERGWVQ